MKVRKRDGSFQNFDQDKIYSAIMKAMIEVDEVDSKLALDIATSITNNVSDGVTINEIQDMVEHKLMCQASYKLAKAYITYRYLHDTARENYQKVINIIQEKGSAKNIQNQNANVDEASFGGRKGETIDEILKDYALNHCMCKKSRNHHLNNEIYQHDLSSYYLGLHNCFQRDTRFITDSGIKAFYQFSDKDKIKVLDKNGVWRDATVRYYGKQPMQKVTLTRCNKSVEISCTSNHRWILSDGTVTDDLRVGDRIIPLRDSTNFVIENKRSAEMFCFGFIIGDGCDHGDYIQARLCSDKLQYVDAFNKANYRFYTIKNSNDIVCVKNKEFGKQQFLTTSAWRLLSYKDKIALFNGYMAADGSRTTNTSLVWTSDDRVLLMIKELSALAGYHIFKIRKIENSTNFKDNRMLYEIVFTKHYADNTTWVVTDIEKKKNKEYEAWCVEEPVTHSFTLEGGIVTGNCLSMPLDSLLANGFVTRQVDIRPANSVNTAMQLVAVLFQIQSLQMFGGVAATHLDWTMVPYVRKSFNKHYKDGMYYVENKIYEDNILDAAEISIDDDCYKQNNKAYQYAMNMIIKEVNQATEGLFHNLNSLQSRSGNQLPFSSINYGTCTLPEGRMVIRALLDSSIKGVGKLHKTPIFPCSIFQVGEGINKHEGDLNYDLFKLAIKSTAKRMYPNYVNIDWSVNAGYDKNDPRTFSATMGGRKLQPM